MAVRVQPVDLNTEQDELLGVLERNLTDLPHRRRFKWLYTDHPLGPAWAWLARDGATGEAVGVASVFRRAMWVGGRVELCGQVGDFAIDPGHRSLGPALMLQRATFEPVEAGSLALCYDCPPHERGMSTFRRLGKSASATMTRYARLIRTDGQLEKRLGGKARWLAPLGNALVDLGHWRWRRSPGLEIAVHHGRFGEEFSALDRRVAGGDGIRARRAAEDMNWRYRDDPLGEYHVLVACRKGEVVGHIVLTVSGRAAFVVDLFGALGPEDAADLLDSGARLARNAGVESVHALISSGDPLSATLRRCGFRPRSTGPLVVAHAAVGGGPQALLERGARWSLAYSDVMA